MNKENQRIDISKLIEEIQDSEQGMTQEILFMSKLLLKKKKITKQTKKSKVPLSILKGKSNVKTKADKFEADFGQQFQYQFDENAKRIKKQGEENDKYWWISQGVFPSQLKKQQDLNRIEGELPIDQQDLIDQDGNKQDEKEGKQSKACIACNQPSTQDSSVINIQKKQKKYKRKFGLDRVERKFLVDRTVDINQTSITSFFKPK